MHEYTIKYSVAESLAHKIDITRVIDIGSNIDNFVIMNIEKCAFAMNNKMYSLFFQTLKLDHNYLPITSTDDNSIYNL